MKSIYKNILLLLFTISLIVVIDRMLLNYFGLPLWEWDEKLHYKHQLNITKYWESFGHKPIIINEYGQHDDSFPIKKRKKEFRILNLGDSITMGHGVTKDETYSKFLELILSDSLAEYEIIQAINTGVQGYSTFQELEVLKRSLRFEPDIVTIGFCLNDVTEPFVVNKELGGIGLDYHRVTQAPNKFLSFFLNETGFGRLIQEIRIRKLDAKQIKVAELSDVNKMISNRDDSTYKLQWDFTLKKLNEIYLICKKNNIPVVLLIFPFTFQINNPDKQWPQELLIQNANQNNVDYINFLKVFESKITNYKTSINKYFLDEDHFTPDGHREVGNEINYKIVEILKTRFSKTNTD
jgi:lysophospholipase L1-like esterase